MVGIYIHILESQREAKPPLYNFFPSPLDKGKGIKGIGLPIKIERG